MKKTWILCVDDESEVLRAIERELKDLEDVFPVESAQSADEAEGVINEIHKKGDQLGLILCDHVMPGRNGVDLLVGLKSDERFQATKMVLVTGQAGLDATVRAVNEGKLDYYIGKPWEVGDLAAVASAQLTDYVIEAGLDPLPYMSVLDASRLSDTIYKKGLISDE